MSEQNSLPEDISSFTGKTIAVEAQTGKERAALIATWLSHQQEQNGYTLWRLDCDFQENGVWGGVKQLFEDLVPQINALAPGLTATHDYELAIISPKLRRSIPVQSLNLTDLASPEERVRLYPAERALRIVHGLVDLVRDWKQSHDPSLWVLCCDNFDRAGHLVTSFFSELMRRCGESSRLVLLVAGDTRLEEGIAEHLTPHLLIRPVLEADAPIEVSGKEMAARAGELEARVAGDELASEEQLHALINLWRQAGKFERSLWWQFTAFAMYTYRGFYQDALRLGDAAFANLRIHSAENEDLRFRIINKLVSCYCAIDQPRKALALIEDHALGKISHPVSRSYVYYLLAMLHVRYLPERDLDLGAEYLDLALNDLHASDLPEGDRHFQIAFNRNGLALIKNRQKKYAEAIALCRGSYERLATHLAADRHKLHRSVLLYNIAQVHAAAGESAEAIRYYTEALAIDENYSEYYNERGNAHFNIGQYERALGDYRRAIELSPPYPEVWINVGQCHRALKQWREAIESYGVALDLNPQQHWVYVMRAECYEALEQFDRVLADYALALSIEPAQAQVLANRACILYGMGDLPQSLADLDQAIALSGDNPDLFQNRAVALADLGRVEDAARDLEMYLSLQPEAEDRVEVGLRIQQLRGLSRSDIPFPGNQGALSPLTVAQ